MSFPRVYIIDTTCFDECFLFHAIIVAALFQASALKEVRILYPLSPHYHYNAAKLQDKGFTP